MLASVATITLLFGPNIYPSNLPAALARNVDLGFRTLQVYRIFVVGLGAVILAILWYAFECTNFGAYVRASVDNPSMAEASGINVKRVFSITFALGSGLAALGGAIGFGMLPLEPLYPFKYLTLVLIIVVMAGVGNIRASAVVAVLVGITETAGRYLMPSYGAFFIYAFLIAVLTYRAYPVLQLWRR
jgi:branched-chain amino acid transport system permease protein